MIPISELRKGNLIKTEHGVLPVSAIVWNNVRVEGKDGRKLWANEVDPVDIAESILSGIGLKSELHGTYSTWEYQFPDTFELEIIQDNDGFWFNFNGKWINIKTVHRLQNLYFDLIEKELKINP